MVSNSDILTPNEPAVSGDLQTLSSPEGELHLRFYLPSSDEFALSASAIREVVQQAPDRITPIPNASPLLLGTMNLRGQIIWVADLGQFLENPTPLNTDRSEIPVIAIESDESILGLAVDYLGEMEWLDGEQLKLDPVLSDQIAPYVQGEWVLEQEDEVQTLRLLDHVAILRSARWVT
ncbi:MAG: chemotaxis protein CheW [Microcystaceae cyanobacterium]